MIAQPRLKEGSLRFSRVNRKPQGHQIKDVFVSQFTLFILYHQFIVGHFYDKKGQANIKDFKEELAPLNRMQLEIKFVDFKWDIIVRELGIKVDTKHPLT